MSWSQKQGPAFYKNDVSWKEFGVKPCEFTLWISIEMIPLHTYDITPTAAVWSFIRLNFCLQGGVTLFLGIGIYEMKKVAVLGPKTCSPVCRFHLKCVQEQLVLIGSSDVFIKMFWWVTKWQHCCCLGNLELRSPFEIFHFELGKRHQLLRRLPSNKKWVRTIHLVPF